MADTVTDDLRAAMSSLNEGNGDGGSQDTGGAGEDAPVLGDDAVGHADDAGAKGRTGEGAKEADGGDREAAQRARDDKGRFAKLQANLAEADERETRTLKGKKAAPVVVDVGAAKVEAQQVPVKDPSSAPDAPEAAKPAQELKAPASWKPAAREKWATLPPEIQAEAVRVDRETQRVLHESAPAKRWHQEFQQVLAPHQQLFQEKGIQRPTEAVHAAVSTYAGIHSGPEQSRAQAIAQAIKSSGVRIETLAAVLDGAAPAAQPAQINPEELEERAAARAEQRLFQRIQETQNQRAMAGFSKEVDDLRGKLEFFEDVADDMADLIEVADRRGRALTYQQAYDLACKAHPDIGPVLSQRAEAEAVKARAAQAQKSRVAGVSVRSSPASAPKAEAPDDITGQLRAALEQQRRRS